MRHHIIAGIVITSTLLIAGCQNTLKQQTAIIEKNLTEPQVDYFTDSAFGNPISSTIQPQGEFYNGITYLTFQGRFEDPYVVAYDHNTKQWQGPVKVGENLLGRDDRLNTPDNHGGPAMVIDDQGYIHIAFGGHGATPAHGKNPLGDYHSGEMKHFVSSKPMDISSWQQLNNISPFGTYNQWVKTDNGNLYLFYRHGAHRSNWVYQKSTDNGRTFAAPVSVLKTKVRTDTGFHDSDAWYGLFKKGPNNKIIATLNYHICKGNNRHDGARHNAYYMAMDTKDHVWRNAAGMVLTTPITKEDADINAIVANNGKAWAYRGDVAIDSAGNPHVTQYVGDVNFQRKGGKKQIRHYRWTGDAWTNGVSRDLPAAKALLVVNEPNNIDLLIPQRIKGNGEISWWHSQDGGEHFQKGEQVFTITSQSPLTSAFIRNAHPDAQYMVAGKTNRSDFTTLYLVGQNGAITREHSSAHHLSSAEKKAPKAKRNKR